ncbi:MULTISPECIES: tyrosine-type recombinase/integrase [Rhizobium]|uniref:tyrosine-type recombinase/integrase n=1 Tax=Rhizobium TaxID=379 RepID=UPI000BE98EB8|nr:MULTISPECIES: site-specific integrase [Rhizobium]MBX4996679.1 integrase arm-type DNA-binding domain-containing protein [Rhizobium lentis]PDS68920.1 integrase [Rhizobium phaseoli]
MARNKLSETKIKAISKPGIYGDGDGLYIRAQKGGSKNWVFIWRRGDERNEIGLGGYGQGTAPVSLALAREKADAIRLQLARGEDPRADRRPLQPKTFKDCMDGLLETRKGDWRNAKHKAQWEMTLNDYAKPLHDMPVADIVIGDVKDCLMVHWSERPETANRLRSRIQAVIDYGIAHEWRTAGNPARWKGLLEKVMPARQKLTRGHHKALAYESAPAVVAKLRKSKGVSARMVEFLILNGNRTGEVRGAVWPEFDLEAKVWTIPKERMKKFREHRVPLTDRAVDILKEMLARATGDLVFEGEKGGAAISETMMTKALRAASIDKTITLHGMRSTFRDWAGDCTAHAREVIEGALAHIEGDATEQAYRRSDALDKRRALMTDWSKYLGC